jgi:ABC-type phosphate/phosphonate transport system substrate-binding protein
MVAAKLTTLVSAAALMFALAPLGDAWAEKSEPLRVGLYAPWGGPADAGSRHALMQDAAKRIEGATGRPVQPQVFTRWADFEASAKRGQVDLALVDSTLFTANLGSRARALASWRSGSAWVLAGKNVADVSAARGKRVATAAADSPATTFLVERVFLRGQVDIKSYFGSQFSVPVPTDGVRAVEVGKADVAFVRRGDVGGLSVALELGEWPELTFVAIGNRTGTSEAGAAAAMGTAVTAAIGGSWASGAPQLPGKIGLTKPVLARPRQVERRLRDVLRPVDEPPPALRTETLWMTNSEQP